MLHTCLKHSLHPFKARFSGNVHVASLVHPHQVTQRWYRGWKPIYTRSLKWFQSQCFRITASHFAEVFQRKHHLMLLFYICLELMTTKERTLFQLVGIETMKQED